MQAGDLNFLAYLSRHEGERIGPAMIAKNTSRTDGKSYNRDYVWRRLQDLVESGLILKVGRGEYQISELGVDYLEGKVDVSEIEIDESIEDR